MLIYLMLGNCTHDRHNIIQCNLSDVSVYLVLLIHDNLISFSH